TARRRRTRPRRRRPAAGAGRRPTRPRWPTPRRTPRPSTRPTPSRSPSPPRPAPARRRADAVADTLPRMERTLILVKPDAFARGLTGEIVARFERKGLRIVAAQHMIMSEELASQHYAEHEGKPFYGELVSFITSGPLVALVF